MKRDQEAKLFRDFKKRLKKEKRKTHSQKGADDEDDEDDEDNSDSISDSDKTSREAGPQENSQTCWKRFKAKVDHLRDEADDNPYDDILRETKLLVEVKDILDELNMLRNLVEDQHHVYSLWNGVDPDTQPNRLKFPHLTERLETIKVMMEDVIGVQEAIKTLLDLKQKEATIIEAQTTRRQSDSVMVFTVVTIIFLPASFLASLFALNVDEFPHESGSVAYKSWWIFPIIFGVSLAFSLVFVPVALRANTLRNFRRLWEEHRKKREGNKRRMKKLRDEQSEAQKNTNRPSASDGESTELMEDVDNNPEPTQSTPHAPILPSVAEHQRSLFSRTRKNRLIGYRTG
ncbi:hypothetical protein N7528_008068 [Penicillium herquei]|nr:hypothetical protein N7528_008068 [Penicillium herquei]